jgi:glycolate oxidase FAD binding subunit
MRHLTPSNNDEVIEIINEAGASKQGLEVVGHGTKRGWGHPVKAEASLSTSKLSGIALYEPQELVVSLRAGTPMSELNQELESHGQHLAFEPPDFGPLFAHSPGLGTIAGAIASNLAGPRRIDAGAARDHILGFTAINGRGEEFKSGGRVMKNVTGFDLSKLMCGSFGTLAVITDITLKVLPSPPATKTLTVMDLSAGEAVKIMTAAFNLPHAPSAAAFLPAPLSEQESRSQTLIRFEGWQGSLDHRIAATQKAIAAQSDSKVLDTERSLEVWRKVRDGAPFAKDQSQLWQLSVPPFSAAKVSDAILQQAKGQAYFDCCGGLIWLSLEPTDDAHAQLVRQVIRQAGGSAMLLRAEPEVRARVDVFEPLPEPLSKVTQELRQGFDPFTILNPGRLGELGGGQ